MTAIENQGAGASKSSSIGAAKSLIQLSTDGAFLAFMESRTASTPNLKLAIVPKQAPQDGTRPVTAPLEKAQTVSESAPLLPLPAVSFLPAFPWPTPAVPSFGPSPFVQKVPEDFESLPKLPDNVESSHEAADPTFLNTPIDPVVPPQHAAIPTKSPKSGQNHADLPVQSERLSTATTPLYIFDKSSSDQVLHDQQATIPASLLRPAIGSAAPKGTAVPTAVDPAEPVKRLPISIGHEAPLSSGPHSSNPIETAIFPNTNRPFPQLAQPLADSPLPPAPKVPAALPPPNPGSPQLQVLQTTQRPEKQHQTLGEQQVWAYDQQKASLHANAAPPLTPLTGNSATAESEQKISLLSLPETPQQPAPSLTAQIPVATNVVEKTAFTVAGSAQIRPIATLQTKGGHQVLASETTSRIAGQTDSSQLNRPTPTPQVPISAVAPQPTQAPEQTAAADSGRDQTGPVIQIVRPDLVRTKSKQPPNDKVLDTADIRVVQNSKSPPSQPDVIASPRVIQKSLNDMDKATILATRTTPVNGPLPQAYSLPAQLTLSNQPSTPESPKTQQPNNLQLPLPSPTVAPMAVVTPLAQLQQISSDTGALPNAQATMPTVTLDVPKQSQPTKGPETPSKLTQTDQKTGQALIAYPAAIAMVAKEVARLGVSSERAIQTDPVVAASPQPQATQSMSFSTQPAPIVTAHPVADLAQHMVHHVRRDKPTTLEIALSPEELGKVRLVMTPDGDTMRVVIQAERSETLDLLRRNIETFTAELRQSGFASTQFSFNGWGSAPPAPPQSTAKGQNKSTGPQADEPDPHQNHTKPVAKTGLDLRV